MKNLFFYVKGFMVKYSDTGEFECGSQKLINLVRDVTDKYSVENMSMEKDKLKKLFKHLKKSHNGDRNQLLILFMLSFGIERRNLCLLKWEDIVGDDKENMRLLINGKEFHIPSALSSKLLDMRAKKAVDAKYIFGNRNTKCKVPLSEESINTILSTIADYDKDDAFYKKLTSANVRKWLFRYLFNEGYDLKYIMLLLNVSVKCLGNYISDDELWKGDKKEEEKHSMEEFVSGIF